MNSAISRVFTLIGVVALGACTLGDSKGDNPGAIAITAKADNILEVTTDTVGQGTCGAPVCAGGWDNECNAYCQQAGYGGAIAANLIADQNADVFQWFLHMIDYAGGGDRGCFEAMGSDGCEDGAARFAQCVCGEASTDVGGGETGGGETGGGETGGGETGGTGGDGSWGRCYSNSGSCQDVNAGTCGTSFAQGDCPGPYEVQCCLDSNPGGGSGGGNENYFSACTASGAAGIDSDSVLEYVQGDYVVRTYYMEAGGFASECCANSPSYFIDACYSFCGSQISAKGFQGKYDKVFPVGDDSDFCGGGLYRAYCECAF